MDGKGRVIDNIYIERFWRIIKYEDIYLKAYENGISLYKGVEKYMHFYNTKRKHQNLNSITPKVLYTKSMAA